MNKTTIFAMIVIALASLTVLLPVTTSAQRTNIAISNDSSIVLEKVYAGILTGPIYDIQTKKVIAPVDIRGGIAARWDVTKKFAIRSFGFADYEINSAKGFGNTAMWAEYKPTKHWKLALGQGPSLTAANHRPHPAADRGHFETFTTSQLPGVMTNLTVSYTPRSITYATTVGIYQQELSYMGSVAGKKWVGTGYYTMSNRQFGGAITYSGKKLQTTLVYKNKDVIANVITYDCGKNIILYADQGYGFQTKSMVRSEQGLLRVWNGKPAKGLWGLGYDAVNKRLKSYLFVTL